MAGRAICSGDGSMCGWPVRRVLSRGRGPMNGHSSATPVTRRLTRSTRSARRRPPAPLARRSQPYSILQPAGLAMPPLSPGARWALTPPFHPYSAKAKWFVFCGAFPQVALAGRYPAPSLHAARTFLTQSHKARGAAIQPSARGCFREGVGQWQAQDGEGVPNRTLGRGQSCARARYLRGRRCSQK